MFEAFVELDLEQLNRSIRDIDPLSTAKAESIQGNIVLMGMVTSTDRARRIAALAALFAPASKEGQSLVQNHLDIAGEQQVQLRCTVAEVSRAACDVIEAAGAPIEWIALPAGAAAAEEHGAVLPPQTIEVRGCGLGGGGGLGLRRLQQVVEREDTPMVRGMIRKIPHLVTVIE